MEATRKNLRARAKEAAGVDLWLLGAVLLLCGLGLVAVLSASSVLAETRYGDAYYLFKRQAISLGLGLALMVVCRFLPPRLYRIGAYPFLFLCLALLVSVLLPGLGSTAGGATSWLRYGTWSFQPSELAKLALVLFLAYSMAKKGERMREFSIGMVPISSSPDCSSA